jgi:hypothetical protein
MARCSTSTCALQHSALPTPLLRHTATVAFHGPVRLAGTGRAGSCSASSASPQCPQMHWLVSRNHCPLKPVSIFEPMLVGCETVESMHASSCMPCILLNSKASIAWQICSDVLHTQFSHGLAGKQAAAAQYAPFLPRQSGGVLVGTVAHSGGGTGAADSMIARRFASRSAPNSSVSPCANVVIDVVTPLRELRLHGLGAPAGELHVARGIAVATRVAVHLDVVPTPAGVPACLELPDRGQVGGLQDGLIQSEPLEVGAPWMSRALSVGAPRVGEGAGLALGPLYLTGGGREAAQSRQGAVAGGTLQVTDRCEGRPSRQALRGEARR